MYFHEPVDEDFSLVPSKFGLPIDVVGVGLNVVLINVQSIKRVYAQKT